MQQGSGDVAVLGLLSRWDHSVLGAGVEHMQSGDDHVFHELDDTLKQLTAIMGICDRYQMQRVSEVPIPVNEILTSAEVMKGLRYLVLKFKNEHPEYAFVSPYSLWTTPPSAAWLRQYHPEEAVLPP